MAPADIERVDVDGIITAEIRFPFSDEREKAIIELRSYADDPRDSTGTQVFQTGRTWEFTENELGTGNEANISFTRDDFAQNSRDVTSYYTIFASFTDGQAVFESGPTDLFVLGTDLNSLSGTGEGIRNIAPGSGDLTANSSTGNNSIYQKPTTTVTVAGGELQTTEEIVKTNRLSKAGTAELKGLWDEDFIPESGDSVEVDINGVRVFTGTVDTASLTGNGGIKIMAQDATKSLLQNRVTAQFNSVPLGNVVSSLVSSIDTGIIYNLPSDIRVSPEFDETPALSVINQVARWGDTLWWVDEENIIHIGEPDSTLHRLDSSFIESDPDAGESEMPYRKVVVYGESPSSESSSGSTRGGQEADHMLRRGTLVATAGEGEPVYRYQSKQIRTQRQAQNVANAIFNEFKRQRANGKVAVIGEGPRIRPLDAIEMPDSLNNEQYLVTSITHTFNSKDGLISDIDVGGLINE